MTLEFDASTNQFEILACSSLFTNPISVSPDIPDPIEDNTPEPSASLNISELFDDDCPELVDYDDDEDESEESDDEDMDSKSRVQDLIDRILRSMKIHGFDSNDSSPTSSTSTANS
ncbi:hypothetical protein DXG01_011055, partial [Tephrocybe rancida]